LNTISSDFARMIEEAEIRIRPDDSQGRNKGFARMIDRAEIRDSPG
jgi:hypothetical protein